MAKLIDFEREYMLFAAAKLRGNGEIKDEELTGLLNETMKEWLSTKASYLGDRTPDEYFAAMSADELVNMMSDYCAANMNVPEPLYGRISKTPECIPALKELLLSGNAASAARSTALMLLCEMNAEDIFAVCAEMLGQDGDISEIAAAKLKTGDYSVAEILNSKYETADSAAKAIILDVLACYPGIDATADKLIDRLYNDTERRAFYANISGKFGDERLLEPLMRLSQLSDMEYFDYIEIINAIDALGGDPGVIREFYGDPDYEALRFVSDDSESEN